MFNKIIVATDLSKASYPLINCLAGMKAYGTEECLLLLCLSVQESASVALSYSSAVLENILKDQKAILEKQGYAVETRVVATGAKGEINRITKDENYSLIVVAAEKESLVKAHLLGGLAYEVISYARKPVLLIRLGENYKDGQVCIDTVCFEIGDRILFPTDFSENAQSAFKVLGQMVDAKVAQKITLLHIQDKARLTPHLDDKLDEFNKVDTERLNSMKTILEQMGNVQVDTMVRFGSPFVEVVNLVKELNIKLVVMGSQGRGFVKELFLGSLSNNVARKSDASVLLVPAEREESTGFQI